MKSSDLLPRRQAAAGALRWARDFGRARAAAGRAIRRSPLSWRQAASWRRLLGRRPSSWSRVFLAAAPWPRPSPVWRPWAWAPPSWRRLAGRAALAGLGLRASCRRAARRASSSGTRSRASLSLGSVAMTLVVADIGPVAARCSLDRPPRSAGCSPQRASGAARRGRPCAARPAALTARLRPMVSTSSSASSDCERTCRA